jgi:DNA-binding Lrp family transcriptional regulator
MAIHDNEKTSIAQLAKLIGQSNTTVDKNINKLRNLDILKREGAAKGGKA